MRHALLWMTGVTALAGVLLSHNPAFAAEAYEFALCARPPEQYVVRFFERLEKIDNLNVNDGFYSTYFSTGFKQRSTPQAVLAIMTNTRQRFSLSMVNMPFSQRTIGLPQVNRGIGRRDVEVTYLALGGRGKILQRANVVCENQHWRADGFAYEPSK